MSQDVEVQVLSAAQMELNNKILATGVFVSDMDGKILCLHRKINFVEGGKYGVPGGVIRKHRGIVGTAIYKLENEVGLIYKKEDLELIGKFEYKSGDKSIVFHLYSLRIIDKSAENIEVNLNLEGHDRYFWETPQNLLKRTDLMVGMYTLLPAYINKL